MPKKDQSDQRDHLSDQYRGIGIKAVAAAAETGCKETIDEQEKLGQERDATIKHKTNKPRASTR